MQAKPVPASLTLKNGEWGGQAGRQVAAGGLCPSDSWG